MCTGGKHCLAPAACSHLLVDHSDYLNILRRMRELPGVKGVYPQRHPVRLPDGRPGRYLLQGAGGAPCFWSAEGSPGALRPQYPGLHGQTPIDVFNKFKDKFYELSKRQAKAVSGALPDVQPPRLYPRKMRSTWPNTFTKPYAAGTGAGFLPHPGTVSTCMFLHRAGPLHPQAGVCGEIRRGQGAAACASAIL